MLRQSEDNPCWLEQSLDNGETWTLAFDYSLCMAAQDLPEVPPALLRDDLLWAIMQMLDVLRDALDDGMSAEQASAVLQSEFKTATGRDLRKTDADALAAAWHTLTPAQRDAVLDYNGDILDVRADMACSGTSATSIWGRLRDIWTDTAAALRSAFTTYGEMIADLFTGGVPYDGQSQTLYDLITWGRSRGGGSAGFGWAELDCPPVGVVTYTWDFRGSPRGWTPYGEAQWVPGVGFHLGTHDSGIMLPIHLGSPVSTGPVAVRHIQTALYTTPGGFAIDGGIGETEDVTWSSIRTWVPPSYVTADYQIPQEDVAAPMPADWLRVRRFNIGGFERGTYYVFSLSLAIARGEHE